MLIIYFSNIGSSVDNYSQNLTFPKCHIPVTFNFDFKLALDQSERSTFKSFSPRLFSLLTWKTPSGWDHLFQEGTCISFVFRTCTQTELFPEPTSKKMTAAKERAALPVSDHYSGLHLLPILRVYIPPGYAIFTYGNIFVDSYIRFA